ncbi:bifunctional phosphopantothenoylcysteine decarboxylase/phosphopantothenate--cysteine ligase CoaBC [Alloiococcus sp. CFN-8]|uniref:bifunctional phosphopantothenoylcysteine decarboxylase/phosphopantothenate--cysteine ligase CoaBC n=1 Tax=Alloiococcus sp. CFN-8 TaxID=3416081 RepID=UPI003CF2067A
MQKKCIVVGVTGGIAAYKALDVISKLKKLDFEIHVIMTKSACEFVTPLSFQALSQNPVITDMFEEPKAWEIQHISLAKKADLILVCPGTANIIGKIANGIADDMLTTTVMATTAPIIIAPAMNTNMYSNPIVQGNIEKLKAFGYNFIDPDEGRLACGDLGKGKLADTETIVSSVTTFLYETKDLIGKKVLVTAGPTIAPIDPVRCITNHSSGKMGYAIAEEARDRGAEVYLISGPTAVKPPIGVNIKYIETNSEMLNSVLDIYDEMDIIIKSAAVSDYKIKEFFNEKIKKNNNDFSLELVKDTDILKTLGEKKKNQILVGFAAESNDVIAYATEKIVKKNLDYIVANDITQIDGGFNSNNNTVTILSKEGKILELDKMNKRAVAKNLFDFINKER